MHVCTKYMYVRTYICMYIFVCVSAYVYISPSVAVQWLTIALRNMEVPGYNLCPISATLTGYTPALCMAGPGFKA
jgi:hypothetical protein